MSDVVVVALIGAVPACISAILGVVSHRKLNEIHIQWNSRLTEMIKTQNELARSEGRESGRQEERDDPHVQKKEL